MNRYERRRQKALARRYSADDVLTVNYGRLTYVDPTVVDPCFLCGGPAKGWPHPDAPEHWPLEQRTCAHGFAYINDEVSLPLCEACFNAEGRDNQVARKVMGSPDMVIQEGGEASLEHVREIAGALKERKHSSEH